MCRLKDRKKKCKKCLNVRRLKIKEIDILIKALKRPAVNQSTKDLSNWIGHQTSPTVVSLKGRLPQIMQDTYTPSCDIIQIHSLFRHGFINKPKSKFNRKIDVFFSDVKDFEKQILVLI